MKVEIPSLKFNFINGLVKRWNLNFIIQLLYLVQKKPIKHYAKTKKWARPTTTLQIYWTRNLWPSLPTLTHFNQTSIYFNLKSDHSIEAILMSIRRHFNSLRNEGQIDKIECKTNRIAQKWENLLKSKKKIYYFKKNWK